MQANGHDQRGRFATGNPGGPGRPRRMVEREYLDALTEAVPLAEWRQIVARAVVQAKVGNDRAREWLGRYLIGNPTPADPAEFDWEQRICMSCGAVAVDAEERSKVLRQVAESLGIDPDSVSIPQPRTVEERREELLNIIDDLRARNAIPAPSEAPTGPVDERRCISTGF